MRECEEITNISGHVIDTHDVEVRDRQGLGVDADHLNEVQSKIEENFLRAYLAEARDFTLVFHQR